VPDRFEKILMVFDGGRIEALTDWRASVAPKHCGPHRVQPGGPLWHQVPC